MLRFDASLHPRSAEYLRARKKQIPITSLTDGQAGECSFASRLRAFVVHLNLPSRQAKPSVQTEDSPDPGG